MDESSKTENKKRQRQISVPILKKKFRDEKVDVCMVPYLGKKYVVHSQKNNKAFNGFRNILVLDLWLNRKYKSVQEQALDEKCPYSLKNLLRCFDGELDIDDLVYHCFFTRPVSQEQDNFEQYRSTSWEKNGDNYIVKGMDLKITTEDLNNYAIILKDVIRCCRPDIILFLGEPLERLIAGYGDEQDHNFTFYNLFEESNISCNIVDYLQIMCNAGVSVQGDEFLRMFGVDTIDFLRSEKKHRNLSPLFSQIDFIERCLINLRNEKGDSKYIGLIDTNIKALRECVNSLIVPDKNYYKPYKDKRNRDNKKND